MGAEPAPLGILLSTPWILPASTSAPALPRRDASVRVDVSAAPHLRFDRRLVLPGGATDPTHRSHHGIGCATRATTLARPHRSVRRRMAGSTRATRKIGCWFGPCANDFSAGQ